MIHRGFASAGWLGALLWPATLVAAELPARGSRMYTETAIPAEAKRSTPDPELARWLKECPRLGAHELIEVARRAHDALVPQNPLPIGRVENIAFPGAQGTVAVRTYHPRARS